ncbi:MAG: alpha-L-rhamnosidase C-terminal domain-containing protein [Bacteroidales bacterium]|uniref:alpha-L-rhamnosidase-related protein n=1 Tax=Candidatus Cryptobacteroides sp. TaxID=2952915 RepID=UPI002A72384E|nr:alpha-L-rhamnosidase C-terminal domain-containing protein [Candidatus Cryptobacteroides sp.]MCI6526041.1 alpha-L-rhamnosidase [Bacteroidales bacterium]MDD6829594.1 alpha-L-rhamnosidase C-terminal domain-containing protein [Bacteroidales bacterium]MDD7135039.1 alpha-L-rhamnosidase C-terminal domain-containing protein [Bacteroidales bacterium]MDD7624543.1 alpha-L-rhamnosidase C-terminal domain-containing protein [Bacteroidales bacterium]MDY5566164.1 alpha-L-rhamnosidase C-terminal domain-cont
MLRNTIACCLLALVPGMALMAQNNIPPVFAGDEELFREDILTRTYITPKQVFWTSSATSVRDAQLLLKPNTGQSDIFASGMCQLVNKGSDKASIILDFGKEIHGGLKIVISTVSPARTPVFRVRFGESVSETCSELNTTTSLVETGSNEVMDLKNNTATNDHAMRDMELTCPYYGSIEIGSTGYRFVRLDLLTDDMLVNLKEVTAILRYRDIPYEGSFNCSDQRLNDIWMTGAYTVHLNMQEYIWDGIKRDRLIWLGDMHPETSTISYVFGEDESVYSSLDLAVKQYPLPNYFNGMSAYSMWYLIMQYDWYMHFGNIDFLRKHGDYIKGLVDLIDTKVDAEGNDELGGGRFLDWPSSPNEKGVHSGYRALIVWAMNDAAKLCRILGDEPQAKKAEAIVARLNKKIMPSNNLKQAEGLMAIAGLKSAEDAAKAILEGGPKGFSTFYGYYMLQALAMDGKYAEALDIISKFWGGMLDLGATTFWEDFNLDWVDNVGRIDEFVPAGKKDIHGDFGAYCYPGFRHSFCHGWASGPTAWMSQHVLGIEPLEPGCRKVSVKPHLGNLEWAEGTCPTPMGNIYVKHVRQADGSVKSTIKAPKGVKVVK